MRYIEPVFRPPSEADSYILQITYGCSHNKCSFCGMYKSKTFKIRPMEEIKEDIKMASDLMPDIRRVFLGDGDAFILKSEALYEILDYLNRAFPLLQRVGIYASTMGILKKSEDELRALKEKKLSIAYLGLESGSQEILNSVNKGVTADEMVDCVVKAQNCGIKMSVIILLGLGGIKNSHKHAIETAKALNRMNPRYMSALTLMLVPGTCLVEDEDKGKFELPSAEGMLKELRFILENLDLKGTIFRSDHASNYLSLKGRFPKDKEILLSTVDYVLNNMNNRFVIRPEFLRGL